MQNGPENNKGAEMIAEIVNSSDAKQSAAASATSRKLEKNLVKIFKLLADETRLRVLMHLVREGELNVSSLCQRLGQSQPAVSHHLALMRGSGLIGARRDGKNNYYSLRSDQLGQILSEVFGTWGPFEGNTIRFKDFALSRSS